MITIVDPVGSRSWETLAASTAAGDLACLLAQCAREALGVWAVLESHGLAAARAHLDLAARDAASGDVVLQKRRLRVDLPAVEFERTLTLHHVLSELENQDIAYVTVDLSLPGSVLRGSRRCSVEQLFVVTVDMWPSGVATTTLHTFSDCWLSHDLRGHKQPDVQKQNAALLRAVLGAVTEQLGAPIEPWDPGVHGAPTEFGFEDFPDDDPDLLDSWFMFEVPRRTEWLHGMVPKDTPRYGTTTSAPVDFVQVAIGDRPIGYVWADARGDAAGYEPRPAAGHAALDVAQDWLMFLGKARRRGLSARDALHEAIRWPGTDRSGTVVRDSLRTSCSVEDVQDLSGREYPSAHALP